MRGVRLQWAVLIAQGGSRGRAGSSWFLSLRLRLAINVFSCIFSNGVTRNAPVSHKLMCRWSYPLYIYLTDVHPPLHLSARAYPSRLPGYPLISRRSGHRGCPLFIPRRRDEDEYRSCPLSTPWRRVEVDSMQGGQACHGWVALMIKYFRTYVF